jgi:hypothetical protein
MEPSQGIERRTCRNQEPVRGSTPLRSTLAIGGITFDASHFRIEDFERSRHRSPADRRIEQSDVHRDARLIPVGVFMRDLCRFCHQRREFHPNPTV